MKGKVAFFNSARGWGFIVRDDKGGKDLFCHWSEIRGVVGYRSLAQGQKVEFDIGIRPSDGKEMAVNVVPLEAPAEGVHHGRRAAADR